MDLLSDLMILLFAEDLIYFTLHLLLSVFYLFQLIHTIENPVIRGFATDTVGFACVLSVMGACFLHHVWLLSFSSKIVVMGVGCIVGWMFYH
jgi:hypothetical protein